VQMSSMGLLHMSWSCQCSCYPSSANAPCHSTPQYPPLSCPLYCTFPSPQVDLWNFFVDKTRENLHVVLCFSPIGDAFRDRLRQFPSLVNCCTIDWWVRWVIPD
jgi:hypothetical protein